jgi:hypothetical protein
MPLGRSRPADVHAHTTPEMAVRAVAAVEARLDVVLAVAAHLPPESDIPDTRAG